MPTVWISGLSNKKDARKERGDRGKMKIADCLVQDREDDDSFLHRQLFPVSVRLYKENIRYRKIIRDMIEYMRKVATTEFSDYGKLRGLSGANVGIPYNIVVLVEKNYHTEVFINPIIIRGYGDKRIVTSNCGSLQLKKPIKVTRYNEISIQYHDYEDKKLPDGSLVLITQQFKGARAATLQHEVDHNNGLLINQLQRNPNDAEKC